MQAAVAPHRLPGDLHARTQAVAVDDVAGHLHVVLLGQEVVLGGAQAAVAAVIDVEHPFAGYRRLLALLLLLLLLRVALPLLLLLMTLSLLLLLRLGHAVQVLRGRCAFARRSRLRRLTVLRLHRLHAFGRRDGLVGPALVSRVVLHVDDAALRVERRRRLALLSMASALAAAAAAAPPVPPELPPALAFLLLALALELAVAGIAAVAAATAAARLRIARVSRLGSIAAGRLGCSRCGGSLSFFVHP